MGLHCLGLWYLLWLTPGSRWCRCRPRLRWRTPFHSGWPVCTKSLPCAPSSLLASSARSATRSTPWPDPPRLHWWFGESPSWSPWQLHPVGPTTEALTLSETGKWFGLNYDMEQPELRAPTSTWLCRWERGKQRSEIRILLTLGYITYSTSMTDITKRETCSFFLSEMTYRTQLNNTYLLSLQDHFFALSFEFFYPDHRHAIHCHLRSLSGFTCKFMMPNKAILRTRYE